MKATGQIPPAVSPRQKDAESLMSERRAAARKVATESVRRAKLAQNRLVQEDLPCIYRRLF